jgi:Ca2+-binding RTX toxin-like protein
VTQVVDTQTTTPAEGTWCNAGPIAVPATGNVGNASPYPSRINVNGAAPFTSQVTVELRDLVHWPNEMDILLVGPTGENLVLMSDAGRGMVGDSVTVTFADNTSRRVPEFDPLETGTYVPTDVASFPSDAWPDPAPPPSGATTLGTFINTNPNGDWHLFIVDDDNFKTGSMGGGWCLTIASGETRATVTDLTSSLNPSLTGDEVTFAATVTNKGEPVTDGTITISDETTDTVLATDLDIDAEGEATFAIDTLSVGDHEIAATYSGTTDFATSDDTLTQRVRVGTSTVLTSTPSPSRLGQAVSFTATVESDEGNPLTAGTVTFRRGTDALGTVDVEQGRATFTTSELVHGVHAITATYNAAPGWADSSTEPLLHLVDAYGPEARPTPSPRSNGAGWHNRDVTVNWNWLDRDSGIDPANCRGHSSTHGQGARTVTATCADRAGNRSTARYTVNVDSIAPTVTTSSPRPRNYWQGTAVIADYACTDQLSGVAACTGTIAEGDRIPTSTLGVHRFTVTTRDRAGNQHTGTVDYTVVPFPTCQGRRATIVGTGGDDVLIGTSGADVIVTGGGRDWVGASGGDDMICTGGASDVVIAGPGDDTVYSGVGRDSIFGEEGDDTMTGGTRGDVVGGGSGHDTLLGRAGRDNLIGHDGDDDLAGGTGTDTCRGGNGIDHAAACEATLGIP